MNDDEITALAGSMVAWNPNRGAVGAIVVSSCYESSSLAVPCYAHEVDKFRPGIVHAVRRIIERTLAEERSALALALLRNTCTCVWEDVERGGSSIRDDDTDCPRHGRA